MASINSKRTLFFTTSPRTPYKMIPEVKLLTDKFTNQPWNTNTQSEFMHCLVQSDFYIGTKDLKDPALSARDRINRAPKALGFVDLKPTIVLTEAGQSFLSSNHKDEPLLRQLLKFQLPSPYHVDNTSMGGKFCVKPYLEILRLIHHFGGLSFDEVKLFGLQLIDYRDFNKIVDKIEKFRAQKALNKGKYKKFLHDYSIKELTQLFHEEINSGQVKTRESKEKSLEKFITTKLGNLRDYTDACYRYLRATGMVSISHKGKSISITQHKLADVEYILKNVSPVREFIDDEQAFKAYLFDANLPKLLTDDEIALQEKIATLDSTVKTDGLDIYEIKELYYNLIDNQKESIINKEVSSIKAYQYFDEILDMFNGYANTIEPPLYFEWNTWRAMTMIDGGNIKANLHFDDEGQPLSTAPGNSADIVCDYQSFILNVEVTLQSGQKQYDNEGEPVARHVGFVKEQYNKPTYCFFIAPKIHDAVKAHFYVLAQTNVIKYGGKALILPLELNTFKKMVIDSRKASYVPEPRHILNLCTKAQEAVAEAENEIDWYEKVTALALNWLNAA